MSSLNIKFTKSDLFNQKQIEGLITSFIPKTKIELLTEKLASKILFNKDNLYIFNSDNITYKIFEETKVMTQKKYVSTACRNLIQESYINLSKKEQDELLGKYRTNITNKLLKSKFCDDFMDDIIQNLVRNDINFNDPNKYEIHFSNGYFDLKAKVLKPRSKEKHYISVYIPRKYKKPKRAIVKEIKDELRKIINNKDDRDYLLSTLARSLTGDAIDDQTNLFLLGIGSNGKSAIMRMLKFAIDIYMVELKNNTFTEGNTKIDKILNEFLVKSYLRIAWINEMEDKKLDQSLFKTFCEGLLQSTSLYKDGLNNFKHFCKLVFTSNTFPRIIIDGGTQRRIEAYELQALFVDDVNKVNEEKNIFLKDKSFLQKYEKDEKYQNAFFKILGDYCCEYIQDKDKYKSTPNFNDTKFKVVSLNDTIQDFIDNSLIITGNDNDRIDRKEMYNLFLSFNPKTIMKDTQLLSSLGQKGIPFSYKKRVNGNQGTYYGVKVKNFNDELDHGIETPENEHQQIIKAQSEEIAELKNKIKELQQLLNQQNQNHKKEEPKQEKPKQKNTKLVEKTENKEEIKKVEELTPLSADDILGDDIMKDLLQEYRLDKKK